MAPVQTNHDYYAILEIEQTADANSIRASYRRLAKIKHPDKNLTNPNATLEFQLIQEAYSTLSDAEARRSYDLRYPSIKRPAGHTETFPKTASKAVPTTAPNTASKRRSAGHETANEKRTGERHKSILQQLRAKRTLQNDDLLNATRVLCGLQDEVARLTEEIDRAAKEIAAMEKTRAYRTLLPTAQMLEAEKKKERAQRERFNKIVVFKLKHCTMERQEEKVRTCEASLQFTENEIIKVKNDIRRERARREQAEEEKSKKKREQEAFRREYDLDAEIREREAAEAKEAQEFWRRREEAEEEESRRLEEEMKEARRRQIYEERINPRKCESPRQNGCLYGGEWDRIERPMVCGRCLTVTQKFAFGCPYCGRIACDFCLELLRGVRHDYLDI
ncbi:hypothetical protein McanMca71_001877 [Microsporum canis]